MVLRLYKHPLSRTLPRTYPPHIGHLARKPALAPIMPLFSETTPTQPHLTRPKATTISPSSPQNDASTFKATNERLSRIHLQCGPCTGEHGLICSLCSHITSDQSLALCWEACSEYVGAGLRGYAEPKTTCIYIVHKNLYIPRKKETAYFANPPIPTLFCVLRYTRSNRLCLTVVCS